MQGDSVRDKGNWSAATPAADGVDAASVRWIGALLALGFGLPALVCVVLALQEPSYGAAPALLAALFLCLGVATGLFLWLRATRRKAEGAAARIEGLMDLGWELHERQAPATEALLPVATVSHELRAPLHGLLGLADLLAETELTAEQRSYVDAIRQSGADLARLVDDLLDSSRLTAGRFSLDPVPTEIEPLIEQIAELLAPRAHEKQIGLASRAAPGLPPVRVDAGRLRQVLINLVGNAIRFTQAGAVRIAVEREGPVTEGEITLLFEVADSGAGIAHADQARIFADFERASDDPAGLGLGLAISQRIVAQMGGRIRVAGREGGGSVFRFTLRLPVGGAEPLLSAPPRKRRVLILAAPTLEAETLGEMLGAAGSGVRIAATLAEAAGLLGATAAAGEPYDMMLLEARLAGHRRQALARLHQAAGEALPIVVLLTPAERPPIDALRADGFAAYLIRPVRRSSLSRIAAVAMQRGSDFHADPADREPPAAERRRTETPLHVLIVEDDPVTALLMRAILEKLGHETSEARTAAAARALGAASPASSFDLVLADLQLPGEDGLALIRSIRAGDSRAVPALILAISASSDPTVRSEALSAGAALFLEKPVSPESLRQILDTVRRGPGTATTIRHQTA